jgi:hypothetical protein
LDHPLARRETAVGSDTPNAEIRRKSKEKSIAVLPLKFIGAAQEDNEYLAMVWRMR